MTKFIIHGGATSLKIVSNDDFFIKFSDHRKSLVKVLLCYWARDRKDWPALFKKDKRG
jgi:hypothetical protein